MGKKNMMRVYRAGSRVFLAPAAKYKHWEADAVRQLKAQWTFPPIPRSLHINLGVVAYKPTHVVADLSAIYESVQDALQKAGVLENDCCIKGHDGSNLLVDKLHPRTEITLTLKKD